MRIVKLSLIVLFVFALLCSIGNFISTPTIDAAPKATHQPNGHKGTPDPCNPATSPCGPGDTGRGDPTKSHANCRAQQGEVDPTCPKPTNPPKQEPTDKPRPTATDKPRPTDVPRATATPNDPPPSTQNTPVPQRTPSTQRTPFPKVTPFKYTPPTNGCIITQTVVITVYRYIDVQIQTGGSQSHGRR